jgi:hypothetical protein
LDGDHEGRSDQHDQNEETQGLVFVHQPEKHGEQLEEGEGVNELISEYISKAPDGNLQNVVVIELLLLTGPERILHNGANELILSFRFESGESFEVFVEVELSLLEMEHI